MFPTFKLATVVVETSLGNSPRVYRKPYMVRLVLPVSIFTIGGVRLDKPSVILVSLNLFDAGRFLSFEILLNKTLKGLDIFQCFGFLIVPRRPDAEEV